MVAIQAAHFGEMSLQPIIRIRASTIRRLIELPGHPSYSEISVTSYGEDLDARVLLERADLFQLLHVYTSGRAVDALQKPRL